MKKIDWIVISFALIILAGCATRHAGGGSSANAPQNQNIQVKKGKDGKIRILVRDFIVGNRSQFPFYRYYSYLIFTEKTDSNMESIKAAAKAYLCKIQDVSDADDLKIRKENMAIFYAPVRKGTDVNRLNANMSSVDLINDYNLAFSQTLVNHLKHNNSIFNNFRVGIISYPVPLNINNLNNSIDLENLQSINLTNKNSEKIFQIVRKFKTAVTNNYKFKEVEVAVNLEDSYRKPLKFVKKKVPVLDELSEDDFVEKYRRIVSFLGSWVSPASAEASTNTCL